MRKARDERLELRKMGITAEGAVSLGGQEQLVQNFVEALKMTFPEQSILEETIRDHFQQHNMYWARFEKNLGNASYSYKNGQLYLSRQIDFQKLDPFVLHEMIHSLQDKQIEIDYRKLGLCTMTDFKMEGLALNEAGIQYVVAKMLQQDREKIDYGELSLKTRSPQYYPLLCNLLEQIVVLVGEECLVGSVLWSQSSFRENCILAFGEQAYLDIAKEMDKLLEIRIKISQDANCQKQVTQSIQQFEKIQNKILTSYFNKKIRNLSKVESVEDYQKQLRDFQKYRGSQEKEQFFEKFQQEKSQELNRRLFQIMRMQSQNTPMVTNHRIRMLWQKLRSFFMRKEETVRK